MPLSIPTPSALPPTHRLLATHPAVQRTLGRLSRPALLNLALAWLDEDVQDAGLSNAYLLPLPSSSTSANDPDDLDPDDPYPPSATLAELREVYEVMQRTRGSKRDVLDRIIEGDWRRGVSLYQLAMADLEYLYAHPSSVRWSAMKVVRLSTSDGTQELSSNSSSGRNTTIPRFHPSTFLRNLQREALPDVKAHYSLDRHADLPLWILRVWVVDSPYDTGLGLASKSKSNANANADSTSPSSDSSRTFYIAFPDAAPYVYVSLAGSTDGNGSGSGAAMSRSLKKLAMEGVPKAFSRPRERYTLERTGLSARNLAALCERRGGGRGNAAGGGWGVYHSGEESRDNPLGVTGRGLLTPESIVDEERDGDGGELDEGRERRMKRRREEDPGVVKRRKVLAQGRFGSSARRDDGLGIERLDVRLEDPFPAVNLFAEIDTLDSEPERKRKMGRRSAVDLELERQRGDQDDGWRPDVRVTFQGAHVFAGIRELVEHGLVNGERMPAWMTGEEGVSVGVVRDGRIKGWKGSGV
jgi:central kinetochore subunit Mis15/CHL4